jgi:hypothetical protein
LQIPSPETEQVGESEVCSDSHTMLTGKPHGFSNNGRVSRMKPTSDVRPRNKANDFFVGAIVVQPKTLAPVRVEVDYVHGFLRAGMSALDEYKEQESLTLFIPSLIYPLLASRRCMFSPRTNRFSSSESFEYTMRPN